MNSLSNKISPSAGLIYSPSESIRRNKDFFESPIKPRGYIPMFEITNFPRSVKVCDKCAIAIPPGENTALIQNNDGFQMIICLICLEPFFKSVSEEDIKKIKDRRLSKEVFDAL